jgi:hypothetical protein
VDYTFLVAIAPAGGDEGFSAREGKECVKEEDSSLVRAQLPCLPQGRVCVVIAFTIVARHITILSTVPSSSSRPPRHCP